MNPLKYLERARQQYPSIRYVWGLIGCAAAGAIIAALLKSNAMVAIPVVAFALAGMFITAAFSRLPKNKRSEQVALFLLWACGILFVFVVSLIISAAAFNWPKPLADRLFPTAGPTNIAPPNLRTRTDTDALLKLHEAIGIGKPGNLIAALEVYDHEIANCPKYTNDSGARFLGTLLLALRVDAQNTPSDEWDGFVQAAERAKNDPRPYVRNWSTYLIALYQENGGKIKEAVQILESLANSDNTDWIVRFRAYDRLGYLAQTTGNSEKAESYYLAALRIGTTSKTCENLAILFENDGNFKLAEPIFEDAEKCFERERINGRHPRVGTHYLNLASFYNNYAKFLFSESQREKDPEKKSKPLEGYNQRINKANQLIEKAVYEQPEQLDIYWVGASIAFNAFDEKKALHWINKGQELLHRKDAKALAALKLNDFANVGPFYTAWLRAKVLFELSPKSPALPKAIQDLAQEVPGFSDDPAGRIQAKIAEVQQTGFVDPEDINMLQKMTSAKLFARYVTRLRP